MTEEPKEPEEIGKEIYITWHNRPELGNLSSLKGSGEGLMNLIAQAIRTERKHAEEDTGSVTGLASKYPHLQEYLLQLESQLLKADKQEEEFAGKLADERHRNQSLAKALAKAEERRRELVEIIKRFHGMSHTGTFSECKADTCRLAKVQGGRE